MRSRGYRPRRGPATRADLLAAMRVGGPLDLDRPPPDETFGWDKEEAKAELGDRAGGGRRAAEAAVRRAQRAVLVVLQAMDAGGKDGVIRIGADRHQPGRRAGRTASACRARTSRAHDYLWRIHRELPAPRA